MKTAVSLPDDLYERAEQAAQQLGVNRSQLYARALTKYLQDIGPDPVTERLNELAAEDAKERTGPPIIASGSFHDRLRRLGVVARGEVWWTDFGNPIGSSPGHRRPAVVISSDRFNRSRIDTVIVAAITSNTRLSREPGNVAPPDDLLPKPSVINVTAVFTVDRDHWLTMLRTCPL